MILATSFRKALIRIGKIFPFLMCFIVLMAYTEVLISLYFERFLYFHDCIIVNTPVNFWIANHFEYNVIIAVMTLIVSVAIQACRWNIFASLFLVINILEKTYLDFEMYEWQIYVVCAINIIVSGFFSCKGLSIFLKSHK